MRGQAKKNGIGAHFAASSQPVCGDGGGLRREGPPFLDGPTVYLRSTLPEAADAFTSVLWKIGKEGVVLGRDRDDGGRSIGGLGNCDRVGGGDEEVGGRGDMASDKKWLVGMGREDERRG